MARAKWIFGAPQNTPGEDQKVIPIPPPSNADAKKFGLENVSNMLPMHVSITYSNFPQSLEIRGENYTQRFAERWAHDT